MKRRLNTCGGEGVYLPENNCDDCEGMSERISELDRRKQDKLIPGDNITIDGNEISATCQGETYTAGNHITIDNGVISADYGLATTAASGLMSAADKTKLNAIGSRVNSTSITTSVPTDTITAVRQATLSPGAWIVIGRVSFPQVDRGNRAASINTESGVHDSNSYFRLPSAAGTGGTAIVTTKLLTVTEATTIYLNAGQTSQETLTVTTYMAAIRITNA